MGKGEIDEERPGFSETPGYAIPVWRSKNVYQLVAAKDDFDDREDGFDRLLLLDYRTVFME